MKLCVDIVIGEIWNEVSQILNYIVIDQNFKLQICFRLAPAYVQLIGEFVWTLIVLDNGIKINLTINYKNR